MQQRVCTAVGKCQEMENLKVVGLENHASEWIWIRTNGNATTNPKDYTPIPSTDCKTQYSLSKEDVGFHIMIKYTDSGSREAKFSNAIGPVVPGPPRLLDFVIKGDSKVGGYAKADAKYIGGFEGPSEYWWIRVTKDGKRQQITEPKPISNNSKQDPRQYKIVAGTEFSSLMCSTFSSFFPFVFVTTDDVGCTLKAKCRPIRSDGTQGEIFTSKSSVVLTSP